MRITVEFALESTWSWVIYNIFLNGSNVGFFRISGLTKSAGRSDTFAEKALGRRKMQKHLQKLTKSNSLYVLIVSDHTNDDFSLNYGNLDVFCRDSDEIRLVFGFQQKIRRVTDFRQWIFINFKALFHFRPVQLDFGWFWPG